MFYVLVLPLARFPPSHSGNCHKGSLLTLFLHCPLMALCFVCKLSRIQRVLWERCQTYVDKFVAEASQLFTCSRKIGEIGFLYSGLCSVSVVGVISVAECVQLVSLVLLKWWSVLIMWSEAVDVFVWICSRFAGVKIMTPKFLRNSTCRECEGNIGETVVQEEKLCDEVETVGEYWRDSGGGRKVM